MMHQRIPLLPEEVPIAHVRSHDDRIRYIGSARLMPNGKYLAHAILDEEVLVRAELSLSFPQIARRDVSW